MNFNRIISITLFSCLNLISIHLHGYIGLVFVFLIILSILDIVYKSINGSSDCLRGLFIGDILDLKKRISKLEDKNGTY